MSAPSLRMAAAPDRAHGTHAKYIREKCRCQPCCDANTAARRDYERRRAYAAWGRPIMVDAEPVRVHVRALMAAGLGSQHIGRLAGVSGGSVSRLLYGGSPAGRPPSRSLQPETARKLLAVTVDTAAAGAYVGPVGTRRRLRALVAVGWSQAELARRLGWQLGNLWAVVNNDGRGVESRTAAAVRDLYDELWDQQPPQNTAHQRGAVTRARRLAMAHEWVPPMAWDDNEIDDLAAEPHMGTPVDVALDLAEVEHLRAGGCALDEIARRMGVTVGTIKRAGFRERRRP